MKLSTYCKHALAIDDEYQQFFFVARDQCVDGTRVSDRRLSRHMHRAGTLRRVLKRIRRTVPEAYVVSVVSMKDEARRARVRD